MFLPGHFQNAYVTHDIEKAMQGLSARYGLEDFATFEPDMISGFKDPYLPYLPPDKTDCSPRFHHMAMRREDLGEMRAEIARLDLPLAFEGEVPGPRLHLSRCSPDTRTLPRIYLGVATGVGLDALAERTSRQWCWLKRKRPCHDNDGTETPYRH
jgi:hypothetical protein